MKKIFMAGFVVFQFFLNSCSLPRQSAVITSNITIGMTKQRVERTLGLPYKKALDKGTNGDETEILYYKETIFPKKSANSFDLESVLTFKNDILVSIIQGKETKAGSSTVGCSCQ